MKEPPAPGVFLCRNLEEVKELFSSKPLKDEVETIFNVGGSEIYGWAIENRLVDLLFLTRIDADIECDSFFPNFETSQFELISLPEVPKETQEEFDSISKRNLKYNFEVYRSIYSKEKEN